MEEIALSLSPDVLESCKRGDRSSFRELYNLYKNRIYSTCHRMLGNAQDAEDAAQETFIKVFRSIGKFRGDSSIHTWIYRIAANTCIEHLRKRKNKPYHESIDDPDETSPTISDSGTPVSVRLIIEREIEQLTEGYKTVFVLHEIDGFKHREIAKMLNISEGTSKSQLSAAKAHLRKQLIPYLEVIQNEL